MIHYLYTGDYSDQPDSDDNASQLASILNNDENTEGFAPEDLGPLLLNARVYAIAELYNIPGLKTLATEKYGEAIKENWNGTSFVASLKLIYDTTPESDRLLKDIALNTAGKNAQALCDRGEFVALCKEYGEISYHVLKSSLDHNDHDVTAMECVKCRNTGHMKHGRCLGSNYKWYCEYCRQHFN
jgi:hypothetical protein